MNGLFWEQTNVYNFAKGSVLASSSPTKHVSLQATAQQQTPRLPLDFKLPSVPACPAATELPTGDRFEQFKSRAAVGEQRGHLGGDLQSAKRG